MPDFMSSLHKRTSRDYLKRVMEADKAECAEIACRFDKDYWDGDRKHGFGGYRDDGRWRTVAEAMIQHYGLKAGNAVLDVGCGKSFLLNEMLKAVPGLRVAGIDISAYAVQNAPEPVRPFLQVGSAAKLPYEDKSFDLVISINTLHNLYVPDLWSALKEIQRVGRKHRYLVVEAYRNEREKVNLLYWQLTCRAFHTPEEWEWIYRENGYTGDHSYIYFE